MRREPLATYRSWPMTQTNGPGEKKWPARAGNTAGEASGHFASSYTTDSIARRVKCAKGGGDD